MWCNKLAEKRFYDMLKKRDSRAMEFLYDSYSAVMFGIIMRIMQDETASEQVLEKTFQYIWKNHKEFDPDKQNVCVWIINVTRKVCGEAVGFKRFTKDNSKFSGVSPFSEKKIFDSLFFGNRSVAEVAKDTGMGETEIKRNLRSAINSLVRISEKEEV